MADSVEVPDAMLRSALEFAVGLAAAGAVTTPRLRSPAGLRPFLRVSVLPAAALGAVRRAIEGDEDFRRRVGKVVTSELVDTAGILWLARPEGWQEQLAELASAWLAESERAQGAAAGSLRAEQRRREAAEAARDRLGRERSDALQRVETLSDELAESRRLLREAATDADRARSAQREAEAGRLSAVARAERAEAALAAALDAQASLVQQLERAESARDAALAHTAERTDDRSVAPLANSSRPGRRASPARKPLAVPGGLAGDDRGAVEHLLKAIDAIVLVDGYNVAKTGWPALDLAAQRDATIACCEDVARRFGARLVVVFDGADVVGASTIGRRLVRVVYSPAGVSADDVLRDEVRVWPIDRPVVVVTTDAAVAADVRRSGANVVSSRAFLGVARG